MSILLKHTRSLIKLLIEQQMPVVGISVKEASWKGITTMLESKDPSLEKSKFQKICKKTHFIRYPVCLMRLEMMKVKDQILCQGDCHEGLPKVSSSRFSYLFNQINLVNKLKLTSKTDKNGKISLKVHRK